MVLEAITAGIIGLTYATGDEEHKAKMRKIGSEIADVAEETAGDVISLGKSIFEKLKEKEETGENV